MADFKDKYVDTNRNVAGFEDLTKFDVYMQNHRYADDFTTGYAFVFITKPMLFLYPNKPQGDKITTTERLAYENMTRDHVFFTIYKWRSNEWQWFNACKTIILL